MAPAGVPMIDETTAETGGAKIAAGVAPVPRPRTVAVATVQTIGAHSEVPAVIGLLAETTATTLAAEAVATIGLPSAVRNAVLIGRMADAGMTVPGAPVRMIDRGISAPTTVLAAIARRTGVGRGVLTTGVDPGAPINAPADVGTSDGTTADRTRSARSG